MKVKIIKRIEPWAYGSDEIIDIVPDLAAMWFRSGIAEPIKKEIRTATVSTPETTAKRRGRK